MQARWRNTVLNGIIQRLREGCDLTRLNEAQTELIKFAVSRQRRGSEDTKELEKERNSKSGREQKNYITRRNVHERLGKRNKKGRYKVRYFIRRD